MPRSTISPKFFFKVFLKNIVSGTLVLSFFLGVSISYEYFHLKSECENKSKNLKNKYKEFEKIIDDRFELFSYFKDKRSSFLSTLSNYYGLPEEISYDIDEEIQDNPLYIDENIAVDSENREIIFEKKTEDHKNIFFRVSLSSLENYLGLKEKTIITKSEGDVEEADLILKNGKFRKIVYQGVSGAVSYSFLLQKLFKYIMIGAFLFLLMLFIHLNIHKKYSNKKNGYIKRIEEEKRYHVNENSRLLNENRILSDDIKNIKKFYKYRNELLSSHKNKLILNSKKGYESLKIMMNNFNDINMNDVNKLFFDLKRQFLFSLEESFDTKKTKEINICNVIKNIKCNLIWDLKKSNVSMDVISKEESSLFSSDVYTEISLYFILRSIILNLHENSCVHIYVYSDFLTIRILGKPLLRGNFLNKFDLDLGYMNLTGAQMRSMMRSSKIELSQNNESEYTVKFNYNEEKVGTENVVQMYK